MMHVENIIRCGKFILYIKMFYYYICDVSNDKYSKSKSNKKIKSRTVLFKWANKFKAYIFGTHIILFLEFLELI